MIAAVCFHHFGPYHVARLSAAAKIMHIVAVEFSAKTNEYAWDPVMSDCTFERVIVVPEGDVRDLPRDEQRKRIWAAMDKVEPDVVAVNGWSTPDALEVLTWAAVRQVSVVIMSETTAWDSKRTFLKEWVKRSLVGHAQAALVGGSAHTGYIVELGMPEDCVFKGYDAVDNDYFILKTAESSSGQRPDFLPNGPYFLSSNRFIPKKNLKRLLEAFAAYRNMSDQKPWELVILGDGDLRSELEKKRVQLGLDAAVHMPGFIQYADLPVYYAWASAFVHTSTTEQWGLVVNEAMASSLPVLISERCGCVPDLVENGRNGFTFDPYDVTDLANLMFKISSVACDRSEMGHASREIISHWTTKTFAKGLQQAADAALNITKPKFSIVDKALLWALSRR